MKKDSIPRVLEALNVKPTDVIVSIISLLYTLAGIKGVERKLIVSNITRVYKNMTRDRVYGLLQRLNSKNIIKWEVAQKNVWITLTQDARWEFLKEYLGAKKMELFSECENNLDDLSVVMKREYKSLKNLKKKTLKRAIKEISSLAEDFRKTSKK